MINLKTVIFLLFLASPTSLFSQTTYNIKDIKLSFTSAEKLYLESEKPDYAVYWNLHTRISFSLIKHIEVSEFEKELKQHFPSNEYTLTQSTKFSKGESLHGIFHFANRVGIRKRYVKGLIAYDQKTILVEMEFDPEKNSEINKIVDSFSSIIPASNSASNTQSTTYESSESDEFQLNNQKHSNIPKHLPVNHPNLIKLTAEQKQKFIDAHNKWRSEVGVPPLVWSNDLENYAGEWAIENGKKNCKMQHRSETDYGENLYWSSGLKFNPKAVVDSWGSEKDDYHGEVVGKSNAVVGHYTQIVWRTTTEVGCAAFQCGSALLVVCNYSPAGNWMGQHPYK